MHHLWSRLNAQLLAAVLFPVAVAAASSSRDEIVPMAPFKVTDSSGDFALDVRLDPKTKAITQIVVTWVGPKAERRYLSVGDLLVSIDDKPVKGLLLDDVVGLEGRRMKAGDQQKLVFTDPGSKKGSTKTLTWISRGLRPAAIVKPPDSSANR